MTGKTPDRVRVGIVGAGFGGYVHVPAFRKIEGVEITGIAASTRAAAERVGNEHALPRIFANWRELVESPEIDAVSIATPPASHEEIAVCALQNGKAVFCEKPMALNAQQAFAMAAEARRAGLAAMIDFEFRGLPALAGLKRYIDEERTGTLWNVSINWIVDSWRDPKRQWSWRSVAAQGGGALGALGSHVLDLVLWMFGPVRALTAQLPVLVTTRPDAEGTWREVTADDACHLLLETESGVPVTVSISNVAQYGSGLWIEAQGERASIRAGNVNSRDYGTGFELMEARDGQPWSTVSLQDDWSKTLSQEDGRIEPCRRLMQKFIEAVRAGNAVAAPSFDDGLQVQTLMDAARQADREKKWITILKQGGSEE